MQNDKLIMYSTLSMGDRKVEWSIEEKQEIQCKNKKSWQNEGGNEREKCPKQGLTGAIGPYSSIRSLTKTLNTFNYSYQISTESVLTFIDDNH